MKYIRKYTQDQLASRCSHAPVKVGHLGLIQTLSGIPCPLLWFQLRDETSKCASRHVFLCMSSARSCSISELHRMGLSTWLNSTSIWTWCECVLGYKVTFPPLHRFAYILIRSLDWIISVVIQDNPYILCILNKCARTNSIQGCPSYLSSIPFHQSRNILNDVCKCFCQLLFSFSSVF